uniref:Uncharacterized protein n=1 Tax=Knipowitschia caucasica TaxID=637954 RepID=A0AAV2L8X5_KNICA
MVFSNFALAGRDPFLQSTGNISVDYTTDITPSNWTFAIWGIIYGLMAAVLVYVLSTLFRKNAYGYVYCSLAVLPLIAFSCIGLHAYGAWLHKYHRADSYRIRVLVQNGIAIYATWTTIASLVNLNIVLVTEANMSQNDAATTTLSILLVVIVTWFVLENWLLEKHVRYIVSIYPTVIYGLVGVFTKIFDPEITSRNDIFIVALLATASVLFVLRIVLVIWKHIKRPLYRGVNFEAMEPTEIAQKNKKIFI